MVALSQDLDSNDRC